MKMMAVDLGDSRTGIAVCDKSEFLASPLTVIHEKDFFLTLKKTAEIVKEECPERIIVGLPKSPENEINERSKKCIDFGERLHKKTGVEVVMWDERYTTVTAIGYLNETNVRGQKRKNVVDAVAAVVILEDYMKYKKNTENM